MPAEAPALEGRTLGHYNVVEKLGAGGMGVVYRALDTRLNRSVALKVLALTTIDADRRKRFAQEARAASALNHPNIITIYDIGSDQGFDYIAMEFVAGKTLGALIGRKALLLADTLQYGSQIASGLAAAHGAGILHRDLKPGNIMVTGDGLVKVLDFGLAKLIEPDSESDATRTLAADVPNTEKGAILGTVAYMSPEQAEGKPVDARSDIFSFGSVLYEMATGRRAFQGETTLSTLTAILRDEPKPVSEINATPREIEKIVVRCLRKDPARRFQTMADLRVALLELKDESDSGKLLSSAPAVAASRRSPVRIAAAAVLALVVIAAGGWVAWRLSRPPTPLAAQELKRLTFDTGQTRDPAIAADGKLLAYVSERSGKTEVWLQQVDGGDAVQLSHGGGQWPTFSPDGGKVAYFSPNNEIQVISTLGGSPKTLGRGLYPLFSPDGASIANIARTRGSSLRIMPASGGEAREVGLPIRFASSVTQRQWGWGTWSPDGRYLLYRGSLTGAPEGGPEGSKAGGKKSGPLAVADWWLVPIDGGPAVSTGAGDILRAQGLAAGGIDVPSAWIGDRVLFTAVVGENRNIWLVGLSAQTRRATGPAVQLTFGAGSERRPQVAANGRLVFSSTLTTPNYYRLSLDAEHGRTSGAPQAFFPNSASDFFALTQDGTRMVYCSSRAGNSDVWMRELDSGKTTSLVASPAQEHANGVSANGSRVLYTQAGALWLLTTSGGTPRKVCDECGGGLLTPDGERVLYRHRPSGEERLFVAASGKSGEAFRLPAHHHHAIAFSPDGLWVAAAMYPGGSSPQASTDEGSGGPEPGRLVVLPIREGRVQADEKEWIVFQDLTESGSNLGLEWSPGGNLIYWTSRSEGNLRVMARAVDLKTMQPRGEAFVVYEMPGVGSTPVQFKVARDKMVLLVNEGSGNIWMANLNLGR